ncbi:hypothetical protein DPMN_127291 [Dreissena polymorpha]|uniref:Uncharacterized protein n=1 Tax=Dreissena polymorpha TaxID=45954 RepID=A0A9D4H1P4_DREPO|nr:hypothetical protein DPMN_127291 [Dreissena polymorpha]
MQEFPQAVLLIKLGLACQDAASTLSNVLTRKENLPLRQLLYFAEDYLQVPRDKQKACNLSDEKQTRTT